MKKVFLSSVKIIEHVELEENKGRLERLKEGSDIVELNDILYDDVVPEELEEDEFLSDIYYENNNRKAEIEVVKRNTDKLPQYDFKSSYMLTLKEASLNKEIKTPFAIIKGKDNNGKVKKGTATIYDSIYKLDKKMQFKEQREAVRVGFIDSADTFKMVHYNLEKTKALAGIAHENYPIRKKKRFNHKSVGQIPLSNSTHLIDYYVEITKSRGILWMIWIALIATVLALILSNKTMDGWQFSWDNLTVFKTSISEVQEESQVSMNHKTEVQLVNGSMNIGLVITKAAGSENMQCKIKIYKGVSTESNLIYESGMLPAGGSLGEMQVLEDLKAGNYECNIVCEVYRSTGSYIGSLESQFILKV